MFNCIAGVSGRFAFVQHIELLQTPVHCSFIRLSKLERHCGLVPGYLFRPFFLGPGIERGLKPVVKRDILKEWTVTLMLCSVPFTF